MRMHTSAGIPYAKGTGLICRVPSARLNLHTLGFSPRGTSAGSWYGYLTSFPVPFSWAPGIEGTTQRAAIPGFNLVLIVKILPRFMPVNADDGLRLSSPKRQKQGLRC